jgi:hypothetical protein
MSQATPQRDLQYVTTCKVAGDYGLNKGEKSRRFFEKKRRKKLLKVFLVLFLQKKNCFLF